MVIGTPRSYDICLDLLLLQESIHRSTHCFCTHDSMIGTPLRENRKPAFASAIILKQTILIVEMKYNIIVHIVYIQLNNALYKTEH